MADNGSLTSKQRRAVASLLASPTVKAAADNAGVGERTLYRWLALPEFRAELRAAQDVAITVAIANLAGNATAAAGVLTGIAGDSKASPAARVAAARAVLGELRALREFGDLAGRLLELEQRIVLIWGDDNRPG